MKKASVFLLIMICLCDYGCKSKVLPTPQTVERAQVVQPYHYGSNVYYFFAINESFGKSLAVFVEKHPELEFVGISADDTSGYGYTRGYFVIFRSNAKR